MLKSRLTYTQTGNVGNGVSQEDIDLAKAVPIDMYVELKGGRAACPIHGGKNPTSFRVKNNLWNCGSCGEYGSVIDLVMATQGMSFVEAVKYLIGGGK